MSTDRRGHGRLPQLVAAMAATWSLVGAGPALGEASPPAQAVADDGVFLPYAAAPARPVGVCIVDSGVDVNRDTQGQIAFREAIDGGDPGDVAANKHGTRMAMMAAAAVNGWGMIGTAPGAVRIVSVRILSPGSDAASYPGYVRGIAECRRYQPRYNIKVISLSLGNPRGGDDPTVAAQIDSARDYGMDVLAAAGNASTPTADFPASYPPVLSVAAMNRSRGLCAFTDRGPAIRLLAPGCGLDSADPVTGAPGFSVEAGTSEATAIAAAALGALRAYRPDLTTDQAEGLITASAGGRLDLAAAFRAAGLGSVIALGAARARQYAPRIPPPRASLGRRGRRLVLSLRARPRGVRALVRVRGRRGPSGRVGTLRALEVKGPRISFPAAGAVSVSVRYADAGHPGKRGREVTLRVPR